MRLFLLKRMSPKSKRRDAQTHIADLRRSNGGISEETREDNNANVIELLKALDSVKDQLAASAER